MKKKYYLVRTTIDGYLLAKGEPFYQDEIEGLALVRVDSNRGELAFKGDWSIVDIRSGLFVFKHYSKKTLLDNWVKRYSEELKLAIERVREKDHYKRTCHETLIEKENWRASGYEVE